MVNIVTSIWKQGLSGKWMYKWLVQTLRSVLDDHPYNVCFQGSEARKHPSWRSWSCKADWFWALQRTYSGRQRYTYLLWYYWVHVSFAQYCGSLQFHRMFKFEMQLIKIVLFYVRTIQIRTWLFHTVLYWCRIQFKTNKFFFVAVSFVPI